MVRFKLSSPCTASVEGCGCSREIEGWGGGEPWITAVMPLTDGAIAVR